MPPRQRSFFAQWLMDPLRVAAVAPSGSGLARLITSEISPQQAPVIELGPGTGVFTQALLARGLRADQLALIELGASFVARLEARFPGVQVLHRSAADLASLDPFEGQKAGAIVSGLGLLAMPEPVVTAILQGVVHHLAPGAGLYQFTYGPRCPVPPVVMTSLGLRAEKIGRVWANLPPASVYRITRA